jgi:flagellar motor switch protein FliN
MSMGLEKSLPEMNMDLQKAFGDAPEPFAGEQGLGEPGFGGLPEEPVSQRPLMAEAGAGSGAVSLPGAVMRIPVSVQVVIGSAKLPLSQISELSPGAVIKLDQKLGTPATILVNGREVAKGELFVLEGDGEKLGITITEVSASA